MHDYEMRILAADHRRELMAESDRARLAKAARRPAREPRKTRPGPVRGGSLGLLLARMTARVG